MNRRFILSAFLVVGLGASVIFAHVEVDENIQNPVIETIDKADSNSAPEIKIVQALVEELEKRLADNKSEIDLNALVEETKQLASQLDDAEKTFDAESLKLAAFGAVEGSFVPVLICILYMFDTNRYSKLSQANYLMFVSMILSGAVSKSLAGKIGSLPQAKLNDFLTRPELLKALVAGVAQVGLLLASSRYLPKRMPALEIAVKLLSTALPISITTLWKRIEKRNAAKHIIAHSNSN